MGGSLSDAVGVSQLVDHGLSVNKYDIVLIAEGYAQADQSKWFADADLFANTLFDYAPFSAIDSELGVNVWRIDVLSAESGIDDPLDCNGIPGTGAAPNTCFDAGRCVDGLSVAVSFNEALVYQVADKWVPGWNVILLIMNSTLHAGETHGHIAAFTTTSFEPWMVVALHELGHAGFELADEYESLKGCDPSGPYSDGSDHYYWTDPEPSNPNITTNKDLSTIKWGKFLTSPPTVVPNPDCAKCNPATTTAPRGAVGAFEGAEHHHCWIYRPSFKCRMRNETDEWCRVCRGYIQDTLLFWSSYQTWPVDWTFPASQAGDVDPWNPQLAWTPGDWESSWELRITDKPTFASAETISTDNTKEMNGTHVAYADASQLPTLKPDRTYQWCVRKVRANGVGAWTKPRAFKTAPKNVVLQYPHTEHGSPTKEYPWELEFGWVHVDGADHYEIEVMDSAGPIFASPVVTEPGELTHTLDVKIDTTLHWHARAIPPKGAAYAGAWSDSVPFVTSKPAVTILKPEDGGTPPYPWPVRLEWDPVKGAAKYRVDIQHDKNHFGKASAQKNLANLPPETTHVDLNMKPRPSADNEAHQWRVHVWGPPPLDEEGSNSGWHTFLNDGEQTAPPSIVSIDPDPQSGSAWEGWAVHTDTALAYWDHTMKWGGVNGATRYNLTLQPWAKKNGPSGNDAVSIPVAATDDEDQQSQDYKQQVRTDKETLNPGPGVGVEGYSWDVYATGPEDLKGLTANEAFGNLGPDLIEPDPPILIEPAYAATGVDLATLTFSFTSQYTPSSKYMVHLEGLMTGGHVDKPVNGNPGAKTSFDLGALGLGTSDLTPEYAYQWRVRAIATDPDVTDLYEWGPTWWFTLAPAPPPVLAFDEPNCSKLPQIFDREPLVPGATKYDFQYERIPVGTSPQDLDTVAPLSDRMSVTWLQADLGPQTATYESLTGITLPAGQVALPLPGTVCDQANYAYRCRYRICKDTNCSNFTEWFHFWEDTS